MALTRPHASLYMTLSICLVPVGPSPARGRCKRSGHFSAAVAPRAAATSFASGPAEAPARATSPAPAASPPSAAARAQAWAWAQARRAPGGTGTTTRLGTGGAFAAATTINASSAALDLPSTMPPTSPKAFLSTSAMGTARGLSSLRGALKASHGAIANEVPSATSGPTRSEASSSSRKSAHAAKGDEASREGFPENPT